MPIISTPRRCIKRTIDIIISLAFLLTIFPLVYFVVAIIVKVTKRGPVLTGPTTTHARHRRALAPTRPRDIAADETSSFTLLEFNLQTDLFIRRLPHIINILRGDFSLVEPSPMPERLHSYQRRWTPATDIAILVQRMAKSEK